MSAAMDRTARRRAAREVGRLGAVLAEIDGTGPTVQVPIVEPAVIDEVARLLHVDEHGADPVDIDECDDEVYEIERLAEIAARGV